MQYDPKVRMNFGEQAVDRAAVAARLTARGVSCQVVEEILKALPPNALGVILYGSQARGDVTELSDIDLLVVATAPRRTEAVGRVNRSTYDREQFQTAAGTLFGMHLARDGVILHDSGGIADALSDIGEIDEGRLWDRLRQLASLLSLPKSEQHLNLPGFVRHARYVLRTATYASALHPGPACFSVAELAQRFDDPTLIELLSSHPAVQGPPSIAVLSELTRRIERKLQAIAPLPYKALADAIVGLLDTSPEASDAGLLILNRDSSDPYAIIPRVIL